MTNRGRRPEAAETSWERVATWYDGWVGDRGSGVPPRAGHSRRRSTCSSRNAGEAILDVGGGQGVLAPYLADAGASVTVVGRHRRS